MRRALIYGLILLGGHVIGQPTIDYLEYFIDNDPGEGNGTSVVITPGTNLDENFTIDLNSVPEGFHIAYIRTQNANGNWSLTYNKPFLMVGSTGSANITSLEYYIDNDPGYGNGTPVTLTPGQIIDHSFSIDLSGVTSGFHIAYVRAQNANGTWSLNLVKPFLMVGSGPKPDITQMEYFFDTDPGHGNGTAVSITAGANVDENFIADLSALNPGFHILFVRTKNVGGTWGITYVKPFLMVGSGPKPDITEMEYYVDSDPGYGNGTSLPVTASPNVSDMFTVDLNGITNGSHILFVRSKNISGTWSLNYQRPFLKVGGQASPIDAIEVYFDTDPGYGNGEIIPVGPSVVIDDTVNVDLNIPRNGWHQMYTRARNTSGVWSLTTIDTVCVTPVAGFIVDSACLGDTLFFLDTSTDVDGSTTYSWDISDSIPDSTVTTGFSHFYDSAGTYPIQLIVANGICADTLLDTVEVFPKTIVEGTVTAGGDTIRSGFLEIYKYDTTLFLSGEFPKIDSIPIDSNGFYTFGHIPAGDYLLFGEGTDSLSEFTIPTYYGTTRYWDSATILSFACDTHLAQIDFDLVVYDTTGLVGKGDLSGYINYPDSTYGAHTGKTGLLERPTRIEGTPVSDVDIILQKVPGGEIVGRATTDDIGFYEFEDIALDSTYEIHVEIPGVDMDTLTYQVTLSSSDTNKTNLNFLVDSIIHIDTVFIGVDDLKLDYESLKVYPNPYRSATNIEFALEEKGRVSIEIFSLIGKKVVTLSGEEKIPGHYRYSFSAKSHGYPAGIYIVRLSIDEKVKTARLIELD